MAILATATESTDQILDAFALGVRTGAAAVRQAETLECDAIAVDRIEVYADRSFADLQGVTYACEIHADETVTAVTATGAVADSCEVGEFEPRHICGQTVSYCGGVIL